MGISLGCSGQQLCWNQVALSRFDRSCPSRVGFIGKNRSATEKRAFVAIVDNHLCATRSHGDNFNKTFLDDIKKSSWVVILINDMGVWWELFQGCCLTEFSKDIFWQQVERFGVMQGFTQSHRLVLWNIQTVDVARLLCLNISLAQFITE